MSYYPDFHHPVYFLIDALQAIGVTVEFAKDERTRGCWGMVFPEYDNRVAVWLIDNRWEHERINEDPSAKTLLSEGALVMHAQRRDMERVGGVYLPLAASPGYEPRQNGKAYDVTFIGYLRDIARVNLLADIAAVYDLSIRQGAFGSSSVNFLNLGCVAVNVPTRYGHPEAYDIPMRVFEIAATGTPLVTNDLPELPELGFLDGVTCITYSKTRSIVDAVRMALDVPHIGSAALTLVTGKHLYSHRARQVVEWLTNGS